MKGGDGYGRDWSSSCSLGVTSRYRKYDGWLALLICSRRIGNGSVGAFFSDGLKNGQDFGR